MSTTITETKPAPKMTKDEAVAWKFQRLAHATGINLQTPDEQEQAEKDAADAEEQRQKDEEAAAEEAESADADTEAKATGTTGKAPGQK